jgi:hypothetical protein
MTIVAAGDRLRNLAIATEVIVIHAPDSEVDIVCGGWPLGVDGTEGGRSTDDSDSSDNEQVLLGKRYTDEPSDLELLCTKSGPGPLLCDGRRLDLKAAKPLPSSD